MESKNNIKTQVTLKKLNNMKKLIYILSLVIILAVTAISCTEEVVKPKVDPQVVGNGIKE